MAKKTLSVDVDVSERSSGELTRRFGCPRRRGRFCWHRGLAWVELLSYLLRKAAGWRGNVMLLNRVVVLWDGGPWPVNASRLFLTLCKTPSSVSHPVNTILLVYIFHLIQRITIPSASILHTSILRPTEFKAGYLWMPPCTDTPSPLFS